MNTDSHELIQRYIAGLTTGEEAALLQDLLKRDDAVARLYLRYMNLDVALEAHAGSQAAVTEMLVSPRRSESGRWTFWLSWRPLTAAATGIVLGVFCASAAWAVVGLRTSSSSVNEPLLDEDFESAETHWPQGFPTQAGTWGGERGRIVGTLSEIVPMDGGGMAELAPAEETTLSYLDRIIDLRGYPQPEAHEVRQIEVTASFHAAAPGFMERYTLRVATFGEAPAEIQSKWVNVPWREMDGTTLTTSKRGLSAPADSVGWQTLSVMMEAPADASSVVISLAAGRLESSAPKTPHYLDNIQARLLISPRTTHTRNRRR